MKALTHYLEYRRIYNSQAKEKIRRADECGYSILNNAHVDCKKDHPSVLESTAAKDLDESYESLKASQMVFVEENGEGLFEGFCYQKMQHRVLRENWKSGGLSRRMRVVLSVVKR
jgi:hypothetical protein